MDSVNLNRNGSFVQRRKMYVDFPFHNLSSKIPIDWSSDDPASLEHQRKLIRQRQEQEYIRKLYNHRIEQKLLEKFRIGPDSHRNLSENSSRNSKDVLQQEVEHFNHSKILSGSARANPEAMDYRTGQDLLPQNYSGSNQNDKTHQQHDKQSIQPERQVVPQERMGSQLQRPNMHQNQQDRAINHGHPAEEPRHLSQSQIQQPRPSMSPQSSTPRNYQADRYISQHSPGYRLPEPKRSESTELMREPHYLPKNYPYDFVKDYRRYIDLLPPSEHPDHPFRNIMPDKLQNFLRDKTKADRKSAVLPTLVTRRPLGY